MTQPTKVAQAISERTAQTAQMIAATVLFWRIPGPLPRAEHRHQMIAAMLPRKAKTVKAIATPPPFSVKESVRRRESQRIRTDLLAVVVAVAGAEGTAAGDAVELDARASGTNLNCVVLEPAAVGGLGVMRHSGRQKLSKATYGNANDEENAGQNHQDGGHEAEGVRHHEMRVWVYDRT